MKNVIAAFLIGAALASAWWAAAMFRFAPPETANMLWTIAGLGTGFFVLLLLRLFFYD